MKNYAISVQEKLDRIFDMNNKNAFDHMNYGTDEIHFIFTPWRISYCMLTSTELCILSI